MCESCKGLTQEFKFRCLSFRAQLRLHERLGFPYNLIWEEWKSLCSSTTTHSPLKPRENPSVSCIHLSCKYRDYSNNKTISLNKGILWIDRVAKLEESLVSLFCFHMLSISYKDLTCEQGTLSLIISALFLYCVLFWMLARWVYYTTIPMILFCVVVAKNTYMFQLSTNKTCYPTFDPESIALSVFSLL